MDHLKTEFCQDGRQRFRGHNLQDVNKPPSETSRIGKLKGRRDGLCKWTGNTAEDVLVAHPPDRGVGAERGIPLLMAQRVCLVDGCEVATVTRGRWSRTLQLVSEQDPYNRYGSGINQAEAGGPEQPSPRVAGVEHYIDHPHETHIRMQPARRAPPPPPPTRSTSSECSQPPPRNPHPNAASTSYLFRSQGDCCRRWASDRKEFLIQENGRMTEDVDEGVYKDDVDLGGWRVHTRWPSKWGGRLTLDGLHSISP
ncbi:hypothetical protein ACLOJK_011317 [Asimina triloba]